MKAYCDDRQALHAPAWYLSDGEVRPVPEVPARLARIGEALACVAGVEIVAPEAFDPLPAIRAVHADDYLEYLRTIHGAWSAEFGGDVLPDTFPRPGHRRGRPPRDRAVQAGYYCFDMAAPITAGTWQAATAAAHCAVSAARAILAGRRAACALCRPPGHHAGADYCGGFCYLNHAAIAAQHLVAGGLRRVAILDVDYHHGNGTQDIFYARRDVLYVSLHADPDTQYPYFWGHADETGAGDGVGYNLNIPLPRGTGEAAWLAALDAAIGYVKNNHPDALVVSLGVDTFEEDDVGDFGVTLAGFAELGRRLGRMDMPVLFVQEGGYNLEAVGPCVATVIGGHLNACR